MTERWLCGSANINDHKLFDKCCSYIYDEYKKIDKVTYIPILVDVKWLINNHWDILKDSPYADELMVFILGKDE